MLKTTLTAIASIAAISLAPAVSAQDAASNASFEVSGGVGMAYDTDISVFSGTLRGGVFTDLSNGFQIGAEGEASFGLGEDTVEGIDVGLGSSLGGFAVGRMGSDKGSFHMRLGYMANTFEFSSGSDSLDADLNGFALGVGGTYFFNENTGVRLDITRTFVDEVEFSDGDSIDLEDSSFGIANASFVYRF